MGRGGAAAARERARAAKARVAADRAEHEQRIEDRVTDYYLAADELGAAEQAAAKAHQDMARAVHALADDLKESADRIADLCGIEVGQVRGLRKAGKALTTEANKTPEAEKAGPSTAPAPMDPTDEVITQPGAA